MIDLGERARGWRSSVLSVTSDAYPAHWEADVVLRDGGTAHLRPIRPDDADRLRRFHSRLSDETIYFRFFSLLRELSDKDVTKYTNVDHVDRVALVATVGEEMIGVVRYERVSPEVAEVAFNIEDSYQGRGVGSVFLEHIAAAARERGVARFVADVLPTNRRMLRVFTDAGYVVSHEMDDGVFRLEFSLEPTENSRAVTFDREHRAEAESVRRLLHPTSVVVVGASRAPRSIGRVLLQHIVDGGFAGSVYAVNPTTNGEGDGSTYASLVDVPGDIDLAVVAVPAADVEAVVAQAAAKGVHGLVVVSEGFAETGEAGGDLQRRLVRAARGAGMRVVGPNSFGLLVTDPEVSLNASLSPVMPPRGRLGFFAQSGALGVALLDNAAQRGLGISSFVSAGNRVDVSGNDLMQFWEDDPSTDAVMLYLETIGNPRKFSRVARRLSRRKPVVVVKSGRARSHAPHGHLVRESTAPAAAVDALFRRCGRDPRRHDPRDVRRRRARRAPAAAGRSTRRDRRQLRRLGGARSGRVRGGGARGRGAAAPAQRRRRCRRVLRRSRGGVRPRRRRLGRRTVHPAARDTARGGGRRPRARRRVIGQDGRLDVPRDARLAGGVAGHLGRLV